MKYENKQHEPLALPVDWQDQLMAEMSRRFELSKRDDDRMVIDDTQIGVEFAADWVRQRLSAHADPGEVERLEKSLTQALSRYADQGVELEVMRAQLTELDALLRDLLNCNTGFKMRQRIEAALSASAEPSDETN